MTGERYSEIENLIDKYLKDIITIEEFKQLVQEIEYQEYSNLSNIRNDLKVEKFFRDK